MNIYIKRVLFVSFIIGAGPAQASVWQNFAGRLSAYAIRNNSAPLFLEHQSQLQHCVMGDYVCQKDFESVKKIMRDNWSTLGSCSESYDEKFVEYLFKRQQSLYYPERPLIVRTLKNNGDTVGFIGYTLYDSLNYDSKSAPYLLDAPLDAGYIEVLAIDTPYRRQGGGSLLLNAAIKDLTAQGAKKISLAVQNSNTSAWKCYEKSGFIPGEKYSDTVTFLVKNVACMA